MGYLVPCAYGNDVVTPLALTAAAPVVPQVAEEPKAEAVPAVAAPADAAPAVAAPDSAVISVKKRASEASPDTLFYGDTDKFKLGKSFKTAHSVDAYVAVPTSYTVSDPIVKPAVAKTVVPSPVVSTPYIASVPFATSYVDPVVAAPVAAAPVPVVQCKNDQGSVVPCA